MKSDNDLISASLVGGAEAPHSHFDRNAVEWRNLPAILWRAAVERLGSRIGSGIGAFSPKKKDLTTPAYGGGGTTKWWKGEAAIGGKVKVVEGAL